MWSVVILAFFFCTVSVSSYPEAPSTDTISLKSDELLLRLQLPIRQCYLQYAPVATHLAPFAPFAKTSQQFEELTDNNICICEIWQPENKPSQLYMSYLFNQDGCDDIENELSEECDKFDDTCVVKFWLNDPSKNPNPSVYKNRAILKCTANSSSDPKDGPKYLVKVEKMDAFDVGRRCIGQAVVDLLNYRIELYRVGSQYFWQIPIFSRDLFIENKLCDPRLFNVRVAMLIHYKCTTELPDLDRHQKPAARIMATTLPSSLHENSKCYMQAGNPWAGVVLQNFMKPPSVAEPVCCCEHEAGIVDLQTSGVWDCPNQRIVQTCSETGSDECVYDFRVTFDDDVHFWCDSVDENDKANGPPNLGTEYFPNYVPKVQDVSLKVGLVDVFKDEVQLRHCINAGYPHWWQNARDEINVDENIREQHDVWASYLNNKIQHKRPNSNIHLHLIFNPKNFVHTWCPTAFDEAFRIKQFGKVYREISEVQLIVRIVCVREQPMELVDQ